MTSQVKSLRELSCADDYDPDSMPVAKARAFIQAYLSPITAIEKVNIRSALGRILAEDIVSPINVPAHINSAMDGYAVCFKDLNAAGETVLRIAGTAFAGKPYSGKVGEKECVRIMTGAIVPQGTDTVIMQETRKRKITLSALMRATSKGKTSDGPEKILPWGKPR